MLSKKKETSFKVLLEDDKQSKKLLINAFKTFGYGIEL